MLERCEWDFSECLDDDRSACVQYEYTREFLRKHSDLKAGLIGEGRVEHLIRFLSFMFTSGKECSNYFPVVCNGFPDTPWLELSRNDRILSRQYRETESELLAPEMFDLRRLQEFAGLREGEFGEWKEKAMQWVVTNGYIDGEKVSFAEVFLSLPHVALTPTHLYKLFPHRSYALIRLDWEKSNNDLIRAFEQLLSTWRPSAFPGEPVRAKQGTKNVRTPFARSGGRGGFVDQLRQLSAMRLKTHYGNSEDVVAFLEAHKSDVPHKNGRSIDNAAAKARAVLSKMEEDGRFLVFSGFV